jgi:hypothetical protein
VSTLYDPDLTQWLQLSGEYTAGGCPEGAAGTAALVCQRNGWTKNRTNTFPEAQSFREGVHKTDFYIDAVYELASGVGVGAW